jgi:hypothetical protein
MGLIGSSGEGGVKPSRRNWGEELENLTGGGYYWLAGNFMKYGASEASFGSHNAEDLPVDSSELIALCAPRLVLVSCGIPERGDASHSRKDKSSCPARLPSPLPARRTPIFTAQMDAPC